jgi:hypothetical protein
MIINSAIVKLLFQHYLQLAGSMFWSCSSQYQPDQASAGGGYIYTHRSFTIAYYGPENIYFYHLYMVFHFIDRPYHLWMSIIYFWTLT